MLNLVTSADATFFRQQVHSLEERGVRTTTVPVPERDADGADGPDRSAADYLRQLRQFRAQPLEQYDLVHANYGLTAPVALSQRRLPVVLSLWGSDVNGTFGPLSRACSRFCDGVIVMSESMRRRLGRDCAVIPHGIDLERFEPMPRTAACERLGWNSDRKHVFFPYPTGREVKDYPRAVRIVEAVRPRLEAPVELVVGGGEVPHAEMPTYYSAADALLLTSRSEGSPNSVKEAMACRLPVVATDVGDVRERLADVSPSVVGQYDSDLIVGLRDVLESGARSNGREAVREVSLERTTEAILEVYREAVGHVEPTVDEPTATL